MFSPRLIAIDPSLTCSGWALFQIETGSLLGVGKIKALPAVHAMAERLNDLQSKIKRVFDELQLGEDDVLVCEAQTTMRDPRAAFVVEQVRCIFEILARERAMDVPGRINPRSVQYEILCLGGSQVCRMEVKAAAVVAVMRLYSQALSQIGFGVEPAQLKRNQDVVDAILLGMLALTRLKSARRAGMELSEVFSERAAEQRRARRRARVGA